MPLATIVLLSALHTRRLEWVATWLVPVYSKCCGTARDCVTATTSARDSKYRFITHIPMVDRGTPPGPRREYSDLHIPCCSISTAHHDARRQMRGIVALRSVWLVLRYTCAAAIRLAPAAGFAPCDSRRSVQCIRTSIELVLKQSFAVILYVDAISNAHRQHHG
jgi:hypothetical protein